MEGNNMKIKAQKNHIFNGMDFLLFEDSPSGKRYVVKPIEIKLEEVKDTDIIEPTFKINDWTAREFIKSMAELAEELGIKTDMQINEERKFEGKLEATEKHVEDMRKLAFTTLKIK